MTRLLFKPYKNYCPYRNMQYFINYLQRYYYALSVHSMLAMRS